MSAAMLAALADWPHHQHRVPQLHERQLGKLQDRVEFLFSMLGLQVPLCTMSTQALAHLVGLVEVGADVGTKQVAGASRAEAPAFDVLWIRPRHKRKSQERDWQAAQGQQCLSRVH